MMGRTMAVLGMTLMLALAACGKQQEASVSPAVQADVPAEQIAADAAVAAPSCSQRCANGVQTAIQCAAGETAICDCAAEPRAKCEPALADTASP